MIFFAPLALLLALLQVPAAVATFEGVFKFADKKFVTIQVDNGNSMRMYITGRTKFIRDGKAGRATDFHDGDKVTVDAERDARLNLLAIKVENAKAEPDKPGDPSK